ncbi:MAG TPA: DUF692 family protein [Bryobacteraceae bacterium]|nr:DUF692 family protein [Bryobacteraceae bacterium]
MAKIAIGSTYEGRDPELLEGILPLVDYLEITPETIAEVRGGEVEISADILTELKNAAGSVKFIVHGVGLSIGSHEGYSANYLRLLDSLLEHLDIEWHSEHLAYTKVDGEHLGIMLALPKTREALDMVAARVMELQRRYAMPFLLENVVHVIPDCPADYSEAGFLNELTRRTGCGLILDVYNLECDSHNHGFDIAAFLSELDMKRVRELHLARGVEHNGFLLDVHSQLARPSTVDLARGAIAGSAGSARVAVFEFMPEAVPGLGYEAIAEQLRQLRSALNN